MTAPFAEQLQIIERELGDDQSAVELIEKACSLADASPLATILEQLAEQNRLSGGLAASIASALASASDTSLQHILTSTAEHPPSRQWLSASLSAVAQAWTVDRVSALALLLGWFRRNAPDQRDAFIESLRTAEREEAAWKNIFFCSGVELLDKSASVLQPIVTGAIQSLAQAPKSISQANAERLLATRVYADDGHFLFELLQNADDAQAQFWSLRVEERALYIEHDGAPFSFPDLIGILSIGQTTKSSDQIGFFGVGFKSVYEVSDRPRVHSGIFDIEIAHVSIPRQIAPVSTRKAENTLLVLPLKSNVRASHILQQARQIPPETLLTLPHVAELRVRGGDDDLCWTETASDGQVLLQCSAEPESSRRYAIHHARYTHEGVREAGKARHAKTLVASRLSQSAAGLQPVPMAGDTIYAFLPTKEATGLRVLIHSRFDVTVDRERLMWDSDWNQRLLESAGSAYAELLGEMASTGLNVFPVLPREGELRPSLAGLGASFKATIANIPCLPIASRSPIAPAKAWIATGALCTALQGVELFPDEFLLPPLSDDERDAAHYLEVRPFDDAALLEFLQTNLRAAEPPPSWWCSAVLEHLADSDLPDHTLRELPLITDQAGRLRKASDVLHTSEAFISLYGQARSLVSTASVQSLPSKLAERLNVKRLTAAEFRRDLLDENRGPLLLENEPAMLLALGTLGASDLHELRDVPILQTSAGLRVSAADGLLRLSSEVHSLRELLSEELFIVSEEVEERAADLVHRWLPRFGVTELVQTLSDPTWLEQHMVPQRETVLRCLCDATAQLSLAESQTLLRLRLWLDDLGHPHFFDDLMGPAANSEHEALITRFYEATGLRHNAHRASLDLAARIGRAIPPSNMQQLVQDLMQHQDLAPYSKQLVVETMKAAILQAPPDALTDIIELPWMKLSLEASAEEIRHALLQRRAEISARARAQLSELPLVTSKAGTRTSPRALWSPRKLWTLAGGSLSLDGWCDEALVLDESFEGFVEQLELDTRASIELVRDLILPNLRSQTPLVDQPAPWNQLPALRWCRRLGTSLGLSPAELPVALRADQCVTPGPLRTADEQTRLLLDTFANGLELADEEWAESLLADERESWLHPVAAVETARMLETESQKQPAPTTLDRDWYNALYAWLRKNRTTFERHESARASLGRTRFFSANDGSLRSPQELVLDPNVPDLDLGWSTHSDTPPDIAFMLSDLFPLDRQKRRMIVESTLDGLDRAVEENNTQRAKELIAFLARMLRAGQAPAEELQDRVRYTKTRTRLKVPVEPEGWEKAKRAWFAEPEDTWEVSRFAKSPPPRIRWDDIDRPSKALLLACGAHENLPSDLIERCLDGDLIAHAPDARLRLARYVLRRCAEEARWVHEWSLLVRAWVPNMQGKLATPGVLYWPTDEALAACKPHDLVAPDVALGFDQALVEKLGFRAYEPPKPEEVNRQHSERVDTPSADIRTSDGRAYRSPARPHDEREPLHAAEEPERGSRSIFDKVTRWFSSDKDRASKPVTEPEPKPEPQPDPQRQEREEARSEAKARSQTASETGQADSPPQRDAPPDLERRQIQQDDKLLFQPPQSIGPQLVGRRSSLRSQVEPQFGFSLNPRSLPAPWLYAAQMTSTRFDAVRQSWLADKLSAPPCHSKEGTVFFRGKLPAGTAVLPLPLYSRIEKIEMDGEEVVAAKTNSGIYQVHARNACEVTMRVRLGRVPDLQSAIPWRDAKSALRFLVADDELPDEVHDFVSSIDIDEPPATRAMRVRRFIRDNYRYDPSYLEDPSLGSWLDRLTQGRSNKHLAALHSAADAKHLGAGVCYELNTLACELMRRVGVPAGVCTGWVLRGGTIAEPDHMWAVALLETQASSFESTPCWIPVDAATTREGRPLVGGRRPPPKIKEVRDRRAKAPEQSRWNLDPGAALPKKPKRPTVPYSQLLQVVHHLEHVTGKKLSEREKQSLKKALRETDDAAELIERLRL